MLRYVAAVGFALLVASPTQADVRSESMLRQFLEGIDASEAWSATSDLILSEGSDTIAENIVLKLEGAAANELQIERLRLRDLQERDGGGFASSEIELTGVTFRGFDSGMATFFDYSIPTATVTGVSMPSFAGIEFDTRRLMSFTARVYALAAEGEIAEIAAPSIVGVTKPGENAEIGEARVEYQNVRATNLSGGVFESQQVGPVLITATSPQGPLDFRIESGGVSQLNLRGFAHIFDEAAYVDGRGDGVWQPLAAELSYKGLSIEGLEGPTFRLAEFVIQDMEGRQPEMPISGEWNRLMDPSIPEDSKADLALEALSNLFSAWRVGTLSMNGLALEAPAENTAFSLASMTFSNFSDEGFDSFLISDVSGLGPDISFELDSFEVRDFVFPDLEAIMLFAALETDASPELHADTVRRAFAGLPRLSHFGMSGFSAGPAADQLVTVASITLDMAGWNDIYAESTDLRVDDLVIPGDVLRQDPEAAPYIDMLGLDSLTIEATLTDRWAPDAGTDSFSFALSVEDIFDVGFSYTLRGATIDWLIRMIAEAGKTENSEEAVMAMMSELTLEHAEIRATDYSLLDRGFTVAAQMQGLNVEGSAYRQQMRGALPFLLSTVIPASLAQTMTAPLQEFIDGGKTLIAEFAPAVPVSIVEIIAAAERDPATIPDLLGLSVRSETASQ